MSKPIDKALDADTAQAFSTSWNNLPEGSVYTPAQHTDWMAPLTIEDLRDKDVLELGCGNASLLFHTASWQPAKLVGVDLGDSVISARANMGKTDHPNWRIDQDDLTQYESPGFDVVYCIGVLHHLKTPQDGLNAVVRNVRPGGSFHCWVYAKEGNALVRLIVEPTRRIACHLPWWFTKYLIATPMVAPYFIYAKTLRLLTGDGKNSLSGLFKWLPLFDYSLWIAKRSFPFFRHVAFDQLVTPQTAYISREEIQRWLGSNSRIDKDSTYSIFRNGNSWKFGGRTLDDRKDPADKT
jgi:SAM-dependent methyltransferase